MKTKTVERLMNETPEHIKQQVSDYTDKVVKLRKEAEDSWEGCDGCNDSDKAMWINGYIRGALANQIELPTYDKVTRLEVISENGRELVKYGVNVELQLQDEDRTLKVFTKIKGGGDE